MSGDEAPHRSEDHLRSVILTLCTGNAARSVIAGQLLVSLGLPVDVITAGTHVIEHQPMSVRTRGAIMAIGLELQPHRSHQVTARDVTLSTLIIAMAPEHVRYMRRHHPAASVKTATLPWLADHLPAGHQNLAERVAAMELDRVDPEVQGEVEDPAGRDDDHYVACAGEIADLLGVVAPRLP